MDIRTTLAELVGIDSRSSLSNAGVVGYVVPRVEALGMRARLYPYTDEAGVEKVNMVAVWPRDFEDDGEVELALVGHTDTVPKPRFPLYFKSFSHIRT
jgi:acetylornithine deacetylase